MPEDFDRKKAETQIKEIKNNKINPYNDTMKKDSRVGLCRGKL
ncbi:hypothetical protein [Rickettsia australis]|uniref:Uncharacterized protein n=1 Tax=Rickettsia australis (strain Cutlack) TaxID=1105110 RepID=H8K9W9_RICAC|nr:hypothetical protein [Rickettsia australis]AFC70457.1 hypothetical protein MC5_00030 [Rickettsia australis str. Cutlack]